MHVVKYPFYFRRGKIRVHRKSRSLFYIVRIFLCFNVFANVRGPAALPDYRVADGNARILVPYDSRFPLICDSYTGYVFCGYTGNKYRLRHYRIAAREHLGRIVLHISGFRIYLCKFSFGTSYRIQVFVVYYGTHARRARVKRHDIFFQNKILLSRYFLCSPFYFILVYLKIQCSIYLKSEQSVITPRAVKTAAKIFALRIFAFHNRRRKSDISVLFQARKKLGRLYIDYTLLRRKKKHFSSNFIIRRKV